MSRGAARERHRSGAAKAPAVIKRSLLLTGAIVLASIRMAGAQSPAPAGTAAVDGDRSAVAAIVRSAVSQVELCALAVRRSRTPGIRAFCTSIVNDRAHTAIAGMQVAQSLGTRNLKFEPSPGTADTIDKLERYSGHEFDRAFLLTQIEADERDQDTVRYAADVATEPSVKRFEDGVLPQVEASLRLAESALRAISQRDP